MPTPGATSPLTKPHSDEAYEGKMRVKEEYYDPKKYNKEKDEEEFWGMVRKLQYHRSASKGSVA